MHGKASETMAGVLWVAVLTFSSVLLHISATATPPQANCTLLMQGYGAGVRQGASLLKLHCNTSNGLPLQIGVNASWIGEHNSDLSGVAVQQVPSACLQGNQQDALPAVSLLYFCNSSHDVVLQDSYVHDVWWEGVPGQWAASLVLFGPSTTVNILGGNFSYNYGVLGSAIRSSGANLMVSQSLFEHNAGGITAAAIWALGGSITIEHSFFMHNNASGNGLDGSLGAAVRIDDCRNAMISNCSMYGNMAYGGGSAVIANNTHLTIYHNNFSRNVAAGIAGSCLFYTSKVEIHDTLFEQNSALASEFVDRSGLAGAVGVSAASMVRMTACKAVGNDAAYAAGFVGVEKSSTLFATGCEFSNNTCMAGQGGVIATDTNSLVVISNCTAQSNKAAQGGVLFAQGSSHIFVTNHSLLLSNTAVHSGGAIQIVGHSSLDMSSGTTCRGNTARQGGAVVVDASRAQIVDSTLVGNSALVPGTFSGYGGAIVLTSSAQVRVSNSVISNNTASMGGGISTLDEDRSAILVLDRAYITTNLAMTYGGGVYAATSRVKIVNGSQIFNNTARMGGGGIRLETEQFVIAQIQASTYGNHAPWDEDISVPPSDMTIATTSPNQPGLVTNLSADGSVGYVINVTGYQGVPTRGVTLIGFITSDTQPDYLRTVMNASFTDGVHLQLSLAPGNYVATLGSNDNRSMVAVIPINLTSCNLGQISGLEGVCQRCNAGSYSTSHNSSQCYSCPTGAVCPGGAVIIPGPGYWRSSALSDQVHRCPNPTACQQSQLPHQLVHWTLIDQLLLEAQQNAQAGQLATNATFYAEKLCSLGYHGNLCGVCAAGYGSSKPFTCRPCMARATMITLYVLGAIVFLGLIKGLCYFTLREATAEALPNSEGTQSQNRVSATDVLKPLVVYFQYLLILVTSVVQWPASFAYPVRALAWAFSPTSPETLSVDCLFSASGLPTGIKKTLFYLCAPLVMLGALLLLEYLLHLLQSSSRRAASKSVVSRLASNAIVVVFFFLPSLVRTTFSLLACVSIDRSGASRSDSGLMALGRFWLLDLQQTCFQGYHKSWSLGMGAPLLAVVCVAWPAFIFILTTRHRKSHDSAFARHYSFLYLTYRSSCTYWEGVVALQTTVLVAVSVFGHSVGSYYQAMLLSLLIGLICLLLVTMKPYAQPVAQRVMELGMVCLLLTSFAALALFPNGYVQDANTSDGFKMAIGVVLVAINICFVGYVCWVLLQLLSWDRVRSVWYTVERFLCKLPGLVPPHRAARGARTRRGPKLLSKACEMQAGMPQC